MSLFIRPVTLTSLSTVFIYKRPRRISTIFKLAVSQFYPCRALNVTVVFRGMCGMCVGIGCDAVGTIIGAYNIVITQLQLSRAALHFHNDRRRIAVY